MSFDDSSILTTELRDAAERTSTGATLLVQKDLDQSIFGRFLQFKHVLGIICRAKLVSAFRLYRGITGSGHRGAREKLMVRAEGLRLEE